MRNEYYNDLMDPMRISSAAGAQAEHDRIRRIEEGRLRAQLESPVFKELQRQTTLSAAQLQKQEKQIAELEKQNKRLSEQIDMFKESEAAAKRKAKWSIAGFWLTTVIAIASLIVAVLAWALPH